MTELFHRLEDDSQAELPADMSDKGGLTEVLRRHQELKYGSQLTHDLQHPEEDGEDPVTRADIVDAEGEE